MIIDVFNVTEQRFANGGAPTLAQQLAQSSLRVVPLTPRQGRAPYEPSLVWHPDSPEIGLVLLGGWSDSDSPLRFGFGEARQPHTRWSPVCLCDRCRWTFSGHERKSQVANQALFGALDRLRVTETTWQVPRFRVYVLRHPELAPKVRNLRFGSGVSRRSYDLVDVTDLGRYLREEPDIKAEGLRRAARLYPAKRPADF